MYKYVLEYLDGSHGVWSLSTQTYIYALCKYAPLFGFKPA